MSLALVASLLAVRPARAAESQVSSASASASAPAIAAYLRARLAERSGQRAQALELLRTALALDPGSAELRISWAEALLRDGQYGRAAAEARRVLERAASGGVAVRAGVALGKALALQGDARGAAEALERAAAAEAARALGARARGDTDEGLVDAEPWWLLARVRLDLGDASGATSACEQLAALDPAAAASGLRDLGSRLLDAQRAEPAAAALARAAALLPGDVGTLRLLAAAEEARGRLDAAAEAWSAALRADPDDPEALEGAAELALRRSDEAAARPLFDRLLAATPDLDVRVRAAKAWLDAGRPADALAAAGSEASPRLSYVRGLALEALGRAEEAAASYGEVGAGAGEVYTAARIRLARALQGAGRLDEAVAALKAGISARPEEPELRFALGMTYERAGEREAALGTMRELLAARPDHAEALNFIAYAYAERGERLDEALRLEQRALELEPGNPYFLDSLGWIRYRRGDLPGALAALEEAVGRLGGEAVVLDHLGDVYLACRRRSDAVAAYRRALDAARGGAPADGFDRGAIERKLRVLGEAAPPVATLP